MSTWAERLAFWHRWHSYVLGRKGLDEGTRLRACGKTGAVDTELVLDSVGVAECGLQVGEEAVDRGGRHDGKSRPRPLRRCVYGVRQPLRERDPGVRVTRGATSA